MTDIAPGWYRDPVDPEIQRYWDGEAYVGEPIPADATPPAGPPPASAPAAPPDTDSALPANPKATTDAGPGSAQEAGTSWTSAPPAAPTSPAPTSAVPSTSPAVPTAGEQPAPGVQPPPGVIPPPGWPAYPRLVLPPPKPHGYALASLGSRLVARMIDTLAILGLNILVNGWFVYEWVKVFRPYWQELVRRMYAGESTSDLAPPERSSTLIIVILILAAALWFAYEVPQLANTGQTLGKRLAHIRVMRLESDEQLGFRRSIRRWNTLGLPTLLWSCFGLGLFLQFADCIWAAIDRPLYQTLHDKSAVTVVVAVPAEGSKGPEHDVGQSEDERNPVGGDSTNNGDHAGDGGQPEDRNRPESGNWT